MAGTATPIFPQTIRNWAQSIVNSDGQTVKTLVTGATNGTKVESIIVTSSDTTLRDLQLSVTISSVTYILATIPIPISSGTIDSVASVDILRSPYIPGLAFDPNGNRYIYVASGSTLNVEALTTVTTGKAIHIFGQGGDF